MTGSLWSLDEAFPRIAGQAGEFAMLARHSWTFQQLDEPKNNASWHCHPIREVLEFAHCCPQTRIIAVHVATWPTHQPTTSPHPSRLLLEAPMVATGPLSLLLLILTVSRALALVIPLSPSWCCTSLMTSPPEWILVFPRFDGNHLGAEQSSQQSQSSA